MFEIYEKNKNKISISFDITLACNNRCPYCIRIKELDNQKLINKEVIEKTILQVLKLANQGYNIIFEIMGGDPLVVIEETLYVIQQLQHKNIELIILTNLNFMPKSKQIRLLQESSKIYNFLIQVSWHNVSNKKWLLSNIKSFTKNIEVNLLLTNENLEEMYNLFKILKSETIAKIDYHEIIDNVTGILYFTNYDNFMYQEMVFDDTSSSRDDGIEINGIFYTTYSKEFRDLKLDRISYQYFTKCFLSLFRIKFDGTIVSECSYEYIQNIKDDLLPNFVFCHNNVCFCDVSAYKILLRKKNNDNRMGMYSRVQL